MNSDFNYRTQAILEKSPHLQGRAAYFAAPISHATIFTDDFSRPFIILQEITLTRGYNLCEKRRRSKNKTGKYALFESRHGILYHLRTPSLCRR